MLCHEMRWRRAVQFGNVAEGVRSLHGIRGGGGRRPRFGSAATARRFRFPPKGGDTKTERTAKP